MISSGNKLFKLRRNTDIPSEVDRQTTENIIDHLQQIVFQTNPAGKFIFLNSTWESLTGYKAENSIGTYLVEYIHPKDKSKVEQYFQLLCSETTDERYSRDIRIVSSSDNSKWMVVRAKAVRDKQNSIVNVTGTFTEVTEKIRKAELLEAKFRSLSNLVNNYPGLAYRCFNDEHFTIEYVNSTCQELTGYDENQLQNNSSFTFKDLIHPSDENRVLQSIQNNLKDGDYFELTHKIITANNQTRWVLNKGKGNFSSSGELLSFEGLLIDFEKQKKEQKQFLKLSLYDPNSNYLNKELFFNRLEHSIQKTKSLQDYVFSYLILGIDQSNQLIENIGDEQYEIIVNEIGKRIVNALEPSVSLCKLQDDQLGILLESSKYTIKDITAILSQIQAQVQAPMSIGENEIYITGSIGVVIGNENYQEKETVFSEAMDAMNRARSLGGARYEFSDLITHGKAALQTHIESELQQALEQDKFHVYWLPLINLQNNTLAGFEAKLVWLHPIRGQLFTDQFLPNAEETQLITPLWEWMLRDASRQIDHWAKSISKVDQISLSIIVTGATLLDTDSILRLREQLLNVKPESCNLVVGVSENVLSHATQTTEAMLKPIKGKEIKLLLDQYGIDETSLLLLKKVHIDVLRLDKTLVENCIEDDGQMIKAICSLAHELNISVIALNVSNQKQVNVLRNAGVDYAQGSNVYKPLDENTVIETLQEITSNIP